MATAILSPSSNSVSSNCGSWVGLQWQASGCAVNTFGQDSVTFSSSIPVGSTITAISGSVSAHTSGVGSTVPGTISISSGTGLGSATLLSTTTMTDTSTPYNYNETGLSIVVGASTFSGALILLFLNKENVYASNHNLSIGDMTVTYTAPVATNSSNNLFFGSPF